MTRDEVIAILGAPHDSGYINKHDRKSKIPSILLYEDTELCFEKGQLVLIFKDPEKSEMVRYPSLGEFERRQLPGRTGIDTTVAK